MTPADPIAVALRVGGALEALGVPYTIGGSIAASFAGEPRSTVDVDFVVALTAAHVKSLVAELAGDFYVAEDALRRAVQSGGTANLIHHDTQLKVDLFVAGGTPLDAQQIARRQRIDMPQGTLYVHPPEDILLQKLRWFRIGGEVSDRQWRDILGIIRTQGTRLDRDYLATNASTLSVDALLARALAEA